MEKEKEKEALDQIKKMKEKQDKEQQEKTEAYIKELQAQDEEELKENTCKICLEPLVLSDQYPIDLETCDHVFHEECIKQFIISKVDDSKFPIVCPEPKCKKTLSDIDIKDILDPKTYKKFNEFQYKNAVELQKDVSWCPTPDCKFVFFFDEEDKKNNSELYCPMCEKHYCLKCRTIYHVGITCEEYYIDSNFEKDDSAFLNFVKG